MNKHKKKFSSRIFDFFKLVKTFYRTRVCYYGLLTATTPLQANPYSAGTDFRRQNLDNSM